MDRISTDKELSSVSQAGDVQLLRHKCCKKIRTIANNLIYVSASAALQLRLGSECLQNAGQCLKHHSSWATSYEWLLWACQGLQQQESKTVRKSSKVHFPCGQVQRDQNKAELERNQKQVKKAEDCEAGTVNSAAHWRHELVIHLKVSLGET